MSPSEQKTPAIIETEILMQRLVHKGSFWLLEGPDDSKFWNLHVVKDKCEKVICGGKTNLIGAIKRLDGKNSLEYWECQMMILILLKIRNSPPPIWCTQRRMI